MKEYFPGVPAVVFEGGYAKHPFAFRYYDPERIVAGRPMREHLRFALPFGAAEQFGYEGNDYLMATLELLHKLGLQYYTASDRQLAPSGGSLRESNAALDEAIEALRCLQEAYAIRPLQISADLHSHPRYSYGAATSYSADVFAYAAAQAKKALEAAQRLGALHFCFTGEQEQRDGFYLSVNDALEQENLLHMLGLVAACAGELNYMGTLCVQPAGGASREAYWQNAQQALLFLRCGGMEPYYCVDLAGGAHGSELRALLQADRLGCIYSDPAASNYYNFFAFTSPVMFELLRAGGLRRGGIVLDIPARHGCITAEDYALNCIYHMDAYAYGLLIAQRILLDGRVEQFRRERYSNYAYGLGKAILEKRVDIHMLESHALQKGEIKAYTARTEYLNHVQQGLLCRGV